ncbi:hypothetical protein OUZ56_011276 [Daphnia magna]|uniref:Uncharacterized protein n=1 Tax=Daphnia magna TaxID=35525 RepID=A0ABQ9YZP3_9CRUS|nr:hypothetical protein OUZ56_011276 [Daphnia magna]
MSMGWIYWLHEGTHDNSSASFLYTPLKNELEMKDRAAKDKKKMHRYSHLLAILLCTMSADIIRLLRFQD